MLPANFFYDTVFYLSELTPNSSGGSSYILYKNILKHVYTYYHLFQYDLKSNNFSIINYEKKWADIKNDLNLQRDECIKDKTIICYDQSYCIQNKEIDKIAIDNTIKKYLEKTITYMLLIGADIKVNKDEIKDNLYNKIYSIHEDSNNSNGNNDVDKNDHIQVIKSETDYTTEYKINHKLKSCTCKGFQYKEKCKHIAKYIK